MKTHNQPIYLVLCLLAALLALSACEPPATVDRDASTLPPPPTPVVETQRFTVERVSGTCDASVDMVADVGLGPMPVRLHLELAGDAGGRVVSGALALESQAVGVACEISTTGRGCEARPGSIPFLPGAPTPAAIPDPDAALEGDQD